MKIKLESIVNIFKYENNKETSFEPFAYTFIPFIAIGTEKGPTPAIISATIKSFFLLLRPDINSISLKCSVCNLLFQYTLEKSKLKVAFDSFKETI
jgi:hypothetical protein